MSLRFAQISYQLRVIANEKNNLKVSAKDTPITEEKKSIPILTWFSSSIYCFSVTLFYSNNSKSFFLILILQPLSREFPFTETSFWLCRLLLFALCLLSTFSLFFLYSKSEIHYDIVFHNDSIVNRLS